MASGLDLHFLPRPWEKIEVATGWQELSIGQFHSLSKNLFLTD